MSTESLNMSYKSDIPYRKDRTNHSGGILMYLSCELHQTRVTGLKKNFWNESLWLEIKDVYMFGFFYSPRTADAIFFDSLKKFKKVRKGAKSRNRYNQVPH